jgi:hypothetical protein
MVAKRNASHRFHAHKRTAAPPPVAFVAPDSIRSQQFPRCLALKTRLPNRMRHWHTTLVPHLSFHRSNFTDVGPGIGIECRAESALDWKAPRAVPELMCHSERGSRWLFLKERATSPQWLLGAGTLEPL